MLVPSVNEKMGLSGFACRVVTGHVCWILPKVHYNYQAVSAAKLSKCHLGVARDSVSKTVACCGSRKQVF